MAHNFEKDCFKILKCIASSQTPFQLEACERIVENLVVKYKNHEKGFKSYILYPKIQDFNKILKKKKNIWI